MKGVHTALRLDRELHERLTAAARERGFTTNFVASKLIAEGLERLIPADKLRLTRQRGGEP